MLIISNLKACICLSNTYTTYTPVVTFFIFGIMSGVVSVFGYISKKRVYDVYDLCIC